MEKKCVIVIDSELPTGLIANTAAVLALTLGNRIKDIIGPNVIDGDGNIHEGITTIPFPILKSKEVNIKELRNIIGSEYPDLYLVDFSNAAQTTKNYDDYTHKIAQYTTNELKYLGIAVYGDKKKINKLTGNLPLLR
ncbi:conserved hypothetical protein [Alkaliphilus metalliredigens QYMF]|uniref:DUF2000 domain-containing protein n=1 Tax=Alkaliphilus metalliredigens (strain QYMF) TaxID=293826 RepID=A6TNG6_ALKMQ|nr:DUF2000 domain-containing protein [Alkaliphilus metalliredigens]ABR47734.1 conserved hypothetical protein [Alkaliphilus metalliredigens QYMF]